MATAENVAKIFLFVPLKSNDRKGTITVTDYQQAAFEFVIGWKNSKGHYKNLINPDYNITGIAVSYDPKTQALYAVQTFGKTLDKIIQDSNKRPTYKRDTSQKVYLKPKPHKRHVWNIKSGEKLKDYDRWKKQKGKYSKKSC